MRTRSITGYRIICTGKSRFFHKAFWDKGNTVKTNAEPLILNMVKAEAIISVIVEIMKEEAQNLGDILAFDGKAIRSTSKKGKPHSALQILTAYMVESGVVLAQTSIDEKTNEIHAKLVSP